MKWTIEEFDRQPFAFVLELIEYWVENPPEHIMLQALAGYRKKRRGGSKEAQKVIDIVAPSTVSDERLLPPWVQDARRLERDAKAKAVNVDG